MKKLIISIIYLLIAVNALADTTINAASCSREDIVTALTSASSETGVVKVVLPPCSATTHTSVLAINMATGFANVTSLTLQGSGSTINNPTFVITTSAAKKFRLTNITFTGQKTSTSYYGIINIYGTTSVSTGGGWRIDHCNIGTLENPGLYPSAGGHRAIWVQGATYGVIDSNEVYWESQFSSVRGQKGGLYGNTEWSDADPFGTAEAVYIEGNHFYNYRTAAQAGESSLINNAFIVDGDGGAKVVARFNKMHNFHFGQHDLTINLLRSTRSWEFYNNTVVNTCSWCLPMVAARGGTGYIYNNVLEHSETNPYWGSGLISLSNKRSYTLSDVGAPWNNLCDSTVTKYCAAGVSPRICTTDADCGGGAGSCVDMDGNIDGTGYPCGDQIGRAQNQTLRPALFWNNKQINTTTTAEKAGTVAVANTGSAVHIKVDRDYCTNATTMPETCNEVETVYTPYTCPHPLADPDGEGSCDYAVAGTTGYTLTGGVTDTTPPTVTSFYIYSGTTVINFSEVITATSGAAFTVAGLASAMTLTCPAVSTAASSMTCTNSRTVYQAEGNGTYGYTGTKVIDAAENQLATIDNRPTAVNLSTEVEEPPAVRLTVNKTGSGCTITSSPPGIIAGTTTTADYDTGTVVTLGGYVENGWTPTIVWGGDCASDGTVTMSGAKTCTATCTEKKVLKWAR